MKKYLSIPSLMLVVSHLVSAQATDIEGSKDHPMFPNRMPNYLFIEYSNNFDAVEFNLAEGQSKMMTKEGNRTFINYGFNSESGVQMPSVLQILRNYENSVKKIGGITLFFNNGEEVAVFKLTKGKSEVFVKVEMGANNALDYTLNIVEVEEMKQEITSNDILTALNANGFMALYINFDIGKADVKPDSQPIIDQLVEMMKANADFKISVEGHTDNLGSAEANKTLSQARANVVMNAMVAKGVSASRLASMGWGQEKPVADNRTEEGRSKNRRVEIVKK